MYHYPRQQDDEEIVMLTARTHSKRGCYLKPSGLLKWTFVLLHCEVCRPQTFSQKICRATGDLLELQGIHQLQREHNRLWTRQRLVIIPYPWRCHRVLEADGWHDRHIRPGLYVLGVFLGPLPEIKRIHRSQRCLRRLGKSDSVHSGMGMFATRTFGILSLEYISSRRNLVDW